ncbi:MAG: hypothetical protein ACO1RT_16275 [Planctomycetaceae bacterium]
MTIGLVCQGCGGDDWRSATYPAQGQVLINGAAPAGAVVELHAAGEKPDSRNSRPWAVVQDDGSYRLTTYTTGDGAPPGQYAVTVRWPPDVNQPSLADRLGGAYAVVERSEWNVTISEGENVLPAIEIDDAKVQSKDAASAPGKASGPTMNGVRS